jgi:hypothetical protein
MIIPVITAEVMTLGVFKQNECVELKQTCSNCSYITITSLLSPLSNNLFTLANMTKQGTDYNYTFCNTTWLGQYIVNGYGDVDGVITIWAYDFQVTASGNILDTAESIIYIIFLVGLSFVFLLFLYGSIVIPYRNNRGNDGKIVSINDVKYFKVVCIVFSYLSLMALFGVMRQISANYLFLNGVYKIFQWMYWFMLSFTFPTMVVSVILALVLFFQDKKIKKALTRGVPFR